MLSEEIGQWFKRLFNRGARPDTEKEFMEDGFYEAAKNMRINPVDGSAGSISKIGGEQPYFRPTSAEQPLANNYVCIGACVVGNDDVAWYCDENEVEPTIVKINGFTMVRSTLIPYRWNFPLQFGDVSKVSGGIVFPADGKSDPLMWRIEEIKQAWAAGEQTYLDNFTLDLVLVQPQAPVEWPEHIDSPLIGVGLPEGQYVYRLRFRTPQGDTTNPGPESPMITVHKHVAQVEAPVGWQYPGAQTGGSQPNPDELVPTETGVLLRWQIDNYLGMAQAELICRRFNTGGLLSDPGVDEVIARFDLGVGEFNNDFRFLDPRDRNYFETIGPDEALQQQASITAVQSVEHVDNRVIYGGFILNDRVADLEFRSVDGVKTFPITQRVFTRYYGETYNDGYADAVNNTYLKTARRNERYGIGLMLWDGASGKSPVVPVEENFTMPDRRDRKTGDSLLYSSDPIYAANNECQGTDPVSPTFDAIVQGNRGKDGQGVNFVNVTQFSAGSPFNPWRPGSIEDQDASRFRFSPISGAALTTTAGVPDAGYQPITGQIWGPQYHALGAAIYGPTNLLQAAPWAKVITPVRTAPAGRVIAQGMGTYRIIANADINSDSGAKSRNELICHFPEMESGVVPEAIQNDINSSPGRYRVILTPFGFYSEVYGYDKVGIFSATHSYALDMLSYAAIQQDSGQVNAGEIPGNMGYQPGVSGPAGSNNWIGPAAWRHTPLTGAPGSVDYSIFTDPANTDQGKFKFTIDSFSPYAEGRGSNWLLRTGENIYRSEPATVTNSDPFNSDTLKRWHEPVYVVTIIRDDREVQTQNVQPYINTGWHIAVDRTIGIAPEMPAAGFFDVELFHARREDAVGPDSTSYRYVYIRQVGQSDRRYVCATGNVNLAAQWTAIQADIAANGFWVAPDGEQVYGFYAAYTNNDGVRPVHYLRFGTYSFGEQPAPGSRIVVKYNPDSPIKVFGFDATIAPSVYAVYDRYYNGVDLDPSGPGQNCVYTSAPLPYSAYLKSVGYNIPVASGLVQNNANITNIKSIRQWIMMWEAEMVVPGRTVTDTGGNGNRQRHAFPRMHYVCHPYRTVSAGGADFDGAGVANGFWPEYDNLYPGEGQWFVFGGFHFRSNYNLDLARQPIVTATGIPRNGVDIRTDYRTAYIASLREDPLQVGVPGLRTFVMDNIFPVSEENGRITRIMSLDQGGFQQLWGWCENGLHRVPYNKNILIGADGNTIGTQSIENFWPREETWVTRGSKGIPDFLWMCSTKANAPVGSGDIDTAVWVDRVSAYQLVGGQVLDIARRPGASKFLSVLQPILKFTPADGRPGFGAVFNKRNGEWWFSLLRDPNDGTGGVSREPEQVVLVYSAVNSEWVGEFSYKYDAFVNDDTRMIGYRRLEANDLDVGVTMLNGDNPVPFEAYVDAPFAPYPFMESELLAWRVAPDKPDEIRVYNKEHELMVTANQALQEAFEPGTGDLWVMKVDGWQQVMNTVDATYDPDRNNPPQDVMYFLRVYHRSATPFRLTFAQLKARQIT